MEHRVHRAKLLSSVLTNALPLRVEFEQLHVNLRTSTLKIENLRLGLKEHGIQRSIWGQALPTMDLFSSQAIQLALGNRKRDVIQQWWWLVSSKYTRQSPKMDVFIELVEPRLYLEFDDIALMKSNWRKLAEALSSIQWTQWLGWLPLSKKSMEQSSLHGVRKKQKESYSRKNPMTTNVIDVRAITVRGNATLQIRSKLLGGMKLVDDVQLSPTYFYQYRSMSLERWIDQLEHIAAEKMLSSDWTKALETVPNNFKSTLKSSAARFLGTTEQVADLFLGDANIADTVQNAIMQVARSRLENLMTGFLYQQKFWQRSTYSRIQWRMGSGGRDWKLSAVFLFP
eukprot:jgi/Galph1/2531/GphlegSOOS_G1206.1